jgi:hypothetical protein
MAIPPRDFRDLVVKRRDACVKFKDDKPGRDRLEALRFYRGDNLADYGDSGDGLSTVVSRDTMEAVESMMPSLVRPFVAGEEVVSFGPIEKGDLESTDQANTYINHVFRIHNNVLEVVQSSLKDGLLFREGIAKTVMEEEEEGGPEEFAGLNLEEMIALQAQALEQGREIGGDIVQEDGADLFDITILPKKAKRYRVHVIAPDEFLREERLASLKQATFLGHTKQITLADLIDMGIDEKKAKELASGRPDSEERDNRFEHEDDEEWDDDDLARPVWVDECYIKTASDDGVLCWYKVLLGGSQSKLLTKEKVDGHPYSHWTPIPIPHKLTGLSIHDVTRDIQMNKTAIQRELNNAMYLTNRPQVEVLDGVVNLDDYLNPTVAGIVRTKEMGSIKAINAIDPRMFGNGLQMVEYFDGMREARTGVTRYNQGMDAQSLNKTATGMNIIASASQQRQELVARQYGEFLLNIFERLLELVSQHAAPEEVERVTGKPFVPWPTSYDRNVSVGLGTNNKDQIIGQLQLLLQVQQQIVETQGGVQGPLVTLDNIHETLKSLQAAMNIKGDHFTDPGDVENQPPPEEEPEQDPLAGERMRQETELAKEGMRQETELTKEQMRQQPVVVPIGGAYGQV